MKKQSAIMMMMLMRMCPCACFVAPTGQLLSQPCWGSARRDALMKSSGRSNGLPLFYFEEKGAEGQ